MNIVIAHFNTNWVNFSGGVEKVTCQLANALCKRGHQVTILYRDGKEGPPYFPLDSSVKTDNILFENGKKVISEKLPPHYRIGREIARVFSQKAAQGINAQHKGKRYGAAIRKRLSQIQPDVIITTSVPSTVYTLTDTISRTISNNDPRSARHSIPLTLRKRKEICCTVIRDSDFDSQRHNDGKAVLP